MSEESPKIESPVDPLIAKIAAAMHQWIGSQQKTIEQAVFSRLDKHRDHVLMTLMGFKADSWGNGRWEIDNCNGRAGNSPIGDYLKTTQEAAIKKWLDGFVVPELSPKDKKQLASSFRDAYYSHLSSKIYEMARDRAAKDLEAFLATVMPSPSLEPFKRMQQLLLLPTTPQPPTD